MLIVISHDSACEFWRNARCQGDADKHSFLNRTLVNLPTEYEFNINNSFAQFLSSQTGLSLPLHLIAPNANARFRSKSVICTVRPKHLPDGSFIEISCPGLSPNDRLLVASPELCFAQMSTQLSFERLVLLGFEFCGTYMIDKSAEFGQRSREPLTTAKSILTYVSKNANMKGLIKARQAARYLIDRSNSPMESKIAIIASLPFMYGGYAMSGLELNAVIKAPSRTMFVDGLWKKEKLIIEYDSDLSHLTSEQHALDKKRTSSLTHLGYRIIPITRSEINTFYAVEDTFRKLRRSLGLRSENASLQKYEHKRRQLVKKLNEDW